MPSGRQLQDRDLLYPLSDLGGSARRLVAGAEAVDPAGIPEPYRGLLVHEDDMTPTLEAYYGSPIHIEVLHMERDHRVYAREVVLRLDDTRRPVQYGASRTFLDRFPPEAAALVLQGRTPLGTIMKTWTIEHVCRPYRFLRVTPGAGLAEAFGVSLDGALFGRQNRIATPDGERLIDVIEVLLP